MFTARGCSFTAYAINLVDELTAELPIKVYLRDLHGQQITGRLGEEEAAGRIILESWLNRQVLYRPDLARENRYGEHLQSQPGYEPVRSAIDVPFYSGTLALASARPDAFSAADIVFFFGSGPGAGGWIPPSGGPAGLAAGPPARGGDGADPRPDHRRQGHGGAGGEN